jgi:hypothetical protein
MVTFDGTSQCKFGCSERVLLSRSKSLVVPAHQNTVTLNLTGERARRGVELEDSLERFIEKFRAALRDFERSDTSREYQVGRGGRPDARSIAATSFRLVGYELGSASLRLEEVAPEEDGKPLRIAADGTATQNLRSLLDSIDECAVDPAVIDDLDEARRSLGDDGSFEVKVPARRKLARIDARTIKRLRTARPEEPGLTEMTVYGRLHLISTEGTPRLEIRGTDGYNWSCSYPDELESEVLRLIKQLVVAQGVGRRERANRGMLGITEISPLPEYDQTRLFSFTKVPAEELERTQGIAGPQGLESLGIADLPDDEEVERYLALMLEE